MKPSLLLLRHELSQDFRRPWAFLILASIPLWIALMMDAVFGSEGESIRPTVQVALLDEDQSAVSQLMVALLASSQAMEVLQITTVESVDEGVRLMRNRRASALVVFPQDMGRDLYDGLQVRLQLYKNPAESILPGIVEQGIEIMAAALSVGAGLLRDPLRMAEQRSWREDVLSEAFVLDIAAETASLLRDARDYFFPPLIQFETASLNRSLGLESPALLSNAEPSVFMTLLPGLLIMWMFFITQTIMEEMITDRRSGLLPRLLSTPLFIHHYVLAKMIRAFLFCMAAQILLVAGSWALLEAVWGDWLMLSVAMNLCAFCAVGLISLIYSVVNKREQANAISSMLILMMALMGGSLIPIDQMPDFMKTWSVFTPNYWGIEALRIAISHGEFRDALPAYGVLIGVGAASSLCSLGLILRRHRKADWR